MHVFVLSRTDGSGALTLGVYTSPESAISELDGQGLGARQVWTPPRPGRAWWELRRGPFIYTIESHRLRDTGPVT